MKKMKIRNTILSKRTLALLAVTALLFCGGGFAGTKAALTYFSNDYTAGFQLDHLQVHLVENENDVCCGENESIYTVHRTNDKVAQEKIPKYKGDLVGYLGYKNENKDAHYGDTPAYKVGTPGKVDPGRTYKEELSARNGNNVDEYVRLTVRKYWVNKEKKKSTVMDPALIKLTYNGSAYNNSAWAVNPKEHTVESDTYYLKNKLGAGADSALLFNELTIDGSVADLGNKKTTTTKKSPGPDNQEVTVITYTYDYDDFTFYIEADVQAIQTHNATDAVKSLWGVSNVSAGNGKGTVR